MYLDYLEALNQQWARLCTLEEFEISTLDDYFEFSEYIKTISNISREITGYSEAQEAFEEIRFVLKSKIKRI